MYGQMWRFLETYEQDHDNMEGMLEATVNNTKSSPLSDWRATSIMY